MLARLLRWHVTGPMLLRLLWARQAHGRAAPTANTRPLMDLNSRYSSASEA